MSAKAECLRSRKTIAGRILRERSKTVRARLGFATIGSTATFIGLFGTVMGIVDAFHGLGAAGAATLRAVAPGISEALITTAAGLAAGQL